MHKRHQTLLAVILCFALFLFFLALKFPYAEAFRRTLQRVQKPDGLEISVQKVEHHFPLSFELQGVTIVLAELGGRQIAADRLLLKVHAVQLLHKKLDVAFELLRPRFDSVYLERKLAGTLSLDLDQLTGLLRMESKNNRVAGLQLYGVDLPEIRFDMAVAEIGFAKDKTLIHGLQMIGSDLSGSLSGQVDRGYLNVAVSIEPDSKILSSNQGLLGQLVQPFAFADDISFRIRGPVSRPVISY
ncbi:MAG: hypothetical protein ACE5HO_21960 [bacterium]